MRSASTCSSSSTATSRSTRTSAWVGGGPRCRRPDTAPGPKLRIALTVAEGHALCYAAPTIRTFVRDGGPTPVDHLGPDLSDEHPDLDEVLARIDRFAAPERPVADVLLDQRIAAGIGNVFKSETLFAVGVHPLTPIGSVDAATRRRLWTTAHRQLPRERAARAAADDGDEPRPRGLRTPPRRVSPVRRRDRIRAGRSGRLDAQLVLVPRVPARDLPSLARVPPAAAREPVAPIAGPLVLVAALAAVTGCLDAVSLARLTKTFVGFQTGNTVLVGLGIGRGDFAAAAGPGRGRDRLPRRERAHADGPGDRRTSPVPACAVARRSRPALLVVNVLMVLVGAGVPTGRRRRVRSGTRAS